MSEPAAQTAEPTSPAAARAPRFLVSRTAVVLIALMWVVAGVTKVYSLPKFLDLIGRHGVLPAEWHSLGLALPFLELVLALVLVFVAGSELRKPFGRATLVFSLAGIIGFAYYLSLVPEAILQESGCGCLGPRIASGIDEHTRLITQVRSGALIALHLVALLGPVVTIRRSRTMEARGPASG